MIAFNAILISTEIKLKKRNGTSKIFVCMCVCVCVCVSTNINTQVFVAKMQKLTGNWREQCNQELHNFYVSQNIVWGNGLRRMR